MSEPGQAPKRLVDDPDSFGGRVLRALPDRVAAPGVRDRLWRSVRPELGRRSNPFWVLIPVAAASAAAAALLVPRPRPPERPLATLSFVAGDVRTSTARHAYEPARAGQGLVNGTTLLTTSAGRAYVRFDDAGTLMGEDTEARVESAAGHGLSVSLAGGSVLSAVRHRSPDRAFLVHCRGYEVRVVGTVFSVTTKNEHDVSVKTTEGAVEVTGPNAHVIVHAGESWSSDTGAAREQNEPARADFARALLEHSPEELAQNILAGWLDRPSAPITPQAEAPTKAPPQPIAEAPHRRAAPATPSRSAPVEAPFIPPTAALPPSPPPGPPIAMAVPPPETDADIYERARRLEEVGRQEDAARLYQSLALGSGPTASSSLYRLGLLQERHLGDPQAAAQTFMAYRNRFPTGDLRPDAAFSLIEVLVSTRRLREAQAEMETFLKDFPQSERRDEVRLWHANARRELGDCAGALNDYGSLRDAHGQLGDDASYFEAFCEQQLGRADDAAKLLQRYLKLWPAGRHAEDAKRALGSR